MIFYYGKYSNNWRVLLPGEEQDSIIVPLGNLIWVFKIHTGKQELFDYKTMAGFSYKAKHSLLKAQYLFSSIS